MDRVVKAPRERVAEMLDETAEGWLHYGEPGKAFEALDAWEQIKNGGDVVVVGHTEYRVEEETPSKDN